MRLWEKLALQIHRKTSEWFQVFLIEKKLEYSSGCLEE